MWLKRATVKNMVETIEGINGSEPVSVLLFAEASEQEGIEREDFDESDEDVDGSEFEGEE